MFRKSMGNFSDQTHAINTEEKKYLINTAGAFVYGAYNVEATNDFTEIHLLASFIQTQSKHSSFFEWQTFDFEHRGCNL